MAHCPPVFPVVIGFSSLGTEGTVKMKVNGFQKTNSKNVVIGRNFSKEVSPVSPCPQGAKAPMDIGISPGTAPKKACPRLSPNHGTRAQRTQGGTQCLPRT